MVQHGKWLRRSLLLTVALALELAPNKASAHDDCELGMILGLSALISTATGIGAGFGFAGLFSLDDGRDYNFPVGALAGSAGGAVAGGVMIAGRRIATDGSCRQRELYLFYAPAAAVGGALLGSFIPFLFADAVDTPQASVFVAPKDEGILAGLSFEL